MWLNLFEFGRAGFKGALPVALSHGCGMCWSPLETLRSSRSLKRRLRVEETLRSVRRRFGSQFVENAPLLAAEYGRAGATLPRSDTP
jgi:hypothetical protein